MSDQDYSSSSNEFTDDENNEALMLFEEMFNPRDHGYQSVTLSSELESEYDGVEGLDLTPPFNTAPPPPQQYSPESEFDYEQVKKVIQEAMELDHNYDADDESEDSQNS